MTPDGQKIAFIGRNGHLAEEDAKDGTLHIRDVNDSTEGEDLGLGYQERDTFQWSPDRKQIVRERSAIVGDTIVRSYVLFDVATKKETSFEVPANLEFSQWLDDGKLYFYEAIRNDPRYPTLPRLRDWTMPAVGGKPTILCENASLWLLKSVGDGSYFGLGRLHENPKNESEYVVYRRWLRISAKGEASVVKTFDEFESVGLKLSPDRRQVACMGQTRGTDPDRTGSSTLLLYDLDGKNERKILTLPNDDKQTQMLGWFPAAK
jgi:Tol biopolymer transport system component